MITVKCTYSNNQTITTMINGTIEDAKSYFFNKVFNIGTVSDNMQKCINVEEIKSKYVKGETIEQFGSVYLVENVYQLTDEYMKEHDLYHRNRVTLVKISGENGMDREDFAITQV